MEAEAADLALQVQAKLTTQFESRMRDIEATMCTVFLPSESNIVKEVQEAGRDCNNMVTNQPTMERRSPDIRFFNAMLKAIVETLVDTADLSPSERGKVDALRLLQQLTEEETFLDLCEWTKSCRHLPTYARPGQAPKTRIIFATDATDG